MLFPSQSTDDIHEFADAADDLGSRINMNNSLSNDKEWFGSTDTFATAVSSLGTSRLSWISGVSEQIFTSPESRSVENLPAREQNSNHVDPSVSSDFKGISLQTSSAASSELSIHSTGSQQSSANDKNYFVKSLDRSDTMKQNKDAKLKAVPQSDELVTVT